MFVSWWIIFASAIVPVDIVHAILFASGPLLSKRICFYLCMASRELSCLSLLVPGRD